MTEAKRQALARWRQEVRLKVTNVIEVHPDVPREDLHFAILDARKPPEFTKDTMKLSNPPDKLPQNANSEVNKTPPFAKDENGLIRLAILISRLFRRNHVEATR